MLLQFNVSNYMSIRDEVVLSAFANASKEHEENIIRCGKDRVLPSLAIYGANAAGKSNIFKALAKAIQQVRDSNTLQIDSPTGFEPFLFDENTKNGKTKMDFLFYHNGKKYAYGFSADMNCIYDEYLYEYKTAKPTMIFERININEYKFTSAYKELAQYKEKNTANKLFMCTATAWNCEATKDAYLWFAEGIDTYDKVGLGEMNQVLRYLNKHKDNEEIKRFMLSLLRHAEINIQDYNLESKVVDSPSNTYSYGMQIDNLKETFQQSRIETVHQIEHTNGSVGLYKLDLNHESEGTMRLFAYGPIIMDALRKGRTIVIDEIDNSLHSNLCRYLIGLFHDHRINQNGAQLIFNTHDVNLLDLELFRRDQVYFVEKDNKTGVSDLYSLADYSPRKNENIQKGYIQGRYGAIPFIKGGIEW